jgi:hypothetical protein
MDIETRVTNLENMLASIVDTLSDNKIYTDADIVGVRKSVSDITPYTETKTAYIDDTEVVFENVPVGNPIIALSNPAIDYTATKDENKVIVSFEPLDEVIEVTISIS